MHHPTIPYVSVSHQPCGSEEAMLGGKMAAIDDLHRLLQPKKTIFLITFLSKEFSHTKIILKTG